MMVSQAYKILLGLGLVFMILPQLNMGLLSDYKICGDSECESPMSRVQAIRDHPSKDCRFLSFRRGDTIFVYHKLTGKRDDLWAGSIDKQFGYFPKDAVQEEHVHVAMEKIVATQESDFFCMDEFGRLIDSSHLDRDDEDGKLQESETTQTTPRADDTHPFKSVFAESPVSAQTSQASTEEDNRENAAAAARTRKEPKNVEGGSASVSWLGSSVTGLLGLAAMEEPTNMAEGQKQGERKETQVKVSSTSTVTGWLGLGGQGQTDDHVKNRDRENADTFTSTVTGWLGFGGKENTDDLSGEEQVVVKGNSEEQELLEKFRSRKMSLDLEGSQLHEEETKGMGTLEWLGKGLSSKLGFGLSNRESGHMEQPTLKDPKETTKEEKQPGSWFHMGIGDILGFGNDRSDVDESKESGFKETDEGKTTEPTTGLENVSSGQSHPAPSEEVKVETTNDSEMVEHQLPGSTNSLTTDDETLVANADRSKDSVSNEGAASRDGHEHTSPQNKGEVKSQSVDRVSSMLNSLFHIGSEEDALDKVLDDNKIENNIPDEERSAEITNEAHHMSDSIESGSENNKRKPGEKESKNNSDQGFLTQSDKGVAANFSCSSIGPPVGENGKTDGDEIQDQTDIADMSLKTGADDSCENEGHDAQRHLPQKESQPPQSDESAEQSQGSGHVEDKVAKVQHLLSTVTAEENTEQVSNISDSSTDHSKDLLSPVDNITEAETHQGKPGQEGEEPQAIGSFRSTDGSTKNLSKDALEEDRGMCGNGESAAQAKYNANEQDSQSVGDADVQKESADEEKDALKESLQTAIGVEIETKEEEEKGLDDQQTVEEDRQDEVNEINAVEEVVEEEETQMEGEDLMGKMLESKQKPDAVNEFTDEVEGKHQVGKLKEEDLEDEVQELEEEESRDELKEIEETFGEEKNVGEEKQSSHYFKTETETQNERRSGTSMGKEKGDPQEEVMKKTKTEEIQENMEDGSECLNELCPQASADGPARERDRNKSGTGWISTDGEETDTREQNLKTDGNQTSEEIPGLSHVMPSENIERHQHKQQEKEQRNDNAGGDEWKENESNITDKEISSIANTTDSDLTEQRNSKELLYSAMNNDDKLYSTDTKNINIHEDNTLHQRDETKFDGTETTSAKSATEEKPEQLQSDHKTVTADDSGDADVLMSKSDGDTVSVEFRPEARSEHPTGSSRQANSNNNGEAEAESGAASELFRDAFRFFGQTSASKTASSLDFNTGETSGAQGSLTPGQKQDSSEDSTPLYIKDVPIASSIAPSQQQPLLPPFPTLSASPSRSHPTSLSVDTGHLLQTKTLSKQYKNLLAHVSLDEMAILLELFGRNKLQFLDYIFGSSETTTEEHDVSILLDIERLLHYHREALVAPNMRLTDGLQESEEKTRMLIALEKLQMLLTRLREMRNSDMSNANNQAEVSCASESCSAQEMTTEKEPGKIGESSTWLDIDPARDKWKDAQLNGGTNERVTEDGKGLQLLEGVMEQLLDFVDKIDVDSTMCVHALRELFIWLTVQVVSALPDDIRPGPDLYGVPWEPVIISGLLGLTTMLLFTCRCYSSVKSRMYQVKERSMAEQVGQLMDEKCKVLETLSKCQQEYDDLESSLRDGGVLAQTEKTEHLEGKVRELGDVRKELKSDLEQLKDQLDQQRECSTEQEKRIAVLEESMKTVEEESSDLLSQHEQAQTTLKVYNMNSDRLQRNLERSTEENTLLQESNAQLRQQVEGWAERVSELEAEMSRCEVTHSIMVQDVANRDERIMSLTDRLLSMKAWDSDLKKEEGGKEETSNYTTEKGEEDRSDTQTHLQKVQKLIYAAKLNADLKSVDEDKDRVFAKLNDEVKAKGDLLLSIKEMENEKISLQSDTENYSDQVQRLQQKLQIMTEMYQENELKLHRLLTVEEKERLQKEEKLNKADKNIALAMEELNNYRQRAAEMEEELEKTKQSYQTQISAHEKKAHNNWLAARAADRELTDIRRENALLRQKLTDTQFKLDTLDKDPFALESLARPLPFRAERSLYGPSPLGRPASETRAFLSPTLMDGSPAARLSPRAPRGPVEPPGGQGEMERSGGPHSDSGSNSPTWDRDRRGPPAGPPPPGYLFPEPGGPLYRRPPPPPGALGYLPPPGSLPPGPLHPRNLPPGPLHPADMGDGVYRENSLGPGEQDHRESGDRRTPPDADPRMVGGPPPGPPMGPNNGPFPRRAPYGPPPSDFYPPRVPGGPPVMPMWPLPPPGVMFPPRFPPGGPPLPPVSHAYPSPPMRPPLPNSVAPSMGPPPPQQTLPTPPQSQVPQEHTPSPEDAI